MDFTLCLTHDCNLRCKYCYAGPKFKRRMPWRVAKRGIDFAVEHTLKQGPPLEIQVGFFGGEPLLEWPTLQRATEYLEKQVEKHEIVLKRTLTTNATLLKEEHAKWLGAHDFYVGLSIDGNRTMHDATRRFRNGRSSHAHSCRALQYYRGPNAKGEVIVTIDPDNVQHIGDSVRWLSNQDICNIALNPNFCTEWSDEAQALWRKGYEEAAEVYIENFRRPRNFRIDFIDGKIKTRVQKGYRSCDKCNFGEKEIAISAKGNIYPCERLVAGDDKGEMCIGNIFDGFDKAYRLKILKRRGNINLECRECALRERCMNWCGCINYATTGAIDYVDGIVCLHEQMTIEIADEVAAELYAEANPYFLAKFYPEKEN
jgi:uncharacterized protein